jgi:hypothetical protein
MIPAQALDCALNYAWLNSNDQLTYQYVEQATFGALHVSYLAAVFSLSLAPYLYHNVINHCLNVR